MKRTSDELSSVKFADYDVCMASPTHVNIRRRSTGEKKRVPIVLGVEEMVTAGYLDRPVEWDTAWRLPRTEVRRG